MTGPQLAWGEGLTASATGFLVAAIHAIGIRITAPAQGDAVTALALELVHVTTGSAVFLWAQEQVSGQIRPPSPALILLAVLSLPLPPPGLWTHQTHLIGAIRTVVIPITFPAPSNAAAVGAGELTLGAGPRGWKRSGERDRAQEGGHGDSPALGGAISPLPVSLKATGDWHNDQDAQPELAALMGPAGSEGAHTYPSGLDP